MADNNSLIGRAVKHRAFGQGTVTSAAENTVAVRFPDGEKRFVYPDAFMQYLVFSDGELQKHAHALYEAAEKLRRDRYLAEQAEIAARSKLENFEVLSNSQAAFNVTDVNEVFRSWTVSTGRYLSGNSKGKARCPDKMRPNSACLLTIKAPAEPETERMIIGAFMVRPDFFGNECEDGVIRAHDEMRIRLEESAYLPFWPYFPGETRVKWGALKYKYFSNMAMQRILQDMAEAEEDDAKRDILAFRHYHGKLCGLD